MFSVLPKSLRLKRFGDYFHPDLELMDANMFESDRDSILKKIKGYPKDTLMIPPIPNFDLIL